MAATDSVRVKQELVDSSFCAPMGKRGEPDEWITSDCPEEETMAARSVSISIKEEPRDTTFSILPGSQDSNNSSDGKMSATSAQSCDSPSAVQTSQRKVRKCFRINEDVRLLQEVVSSRPFERPDKWDVVLRNVEHAVKRKLTMRGIKDRVDLLIGYFRQQDGVNLRKSGTEEQYAERKQLLEEVSDLARAFNYLPRTLPRKGSSTAPTKRPLPSSTQLHLEQKASDAATVESLPADLRFNEPPGRTSGKCRSQLQTNASHPLHGVHEPQLQRPAAPSCQHIPAEQEVSVEEEAGEDTQEDDLCSRNLVPPPVRRRCVQASPRAHRRLQTVGLELLTRREMHEFEIRKRELDLERRRIEYDEKRLALEERKLELEERKHRFEVSCRAEDRQRILEQMERLFQEQQRKIADLLKGKDTT
ncbi:uncharacterized protein LOC135378748 isoform X2 [Ornithodoros turicata]|uniref:uncharacterized protein LOC135378748 isoform X2 n=1 Tax=Ornithodoros turicata TaxID=34597 RepID=UPI00313A0721